MTRFCLRASVVVLLGAAAAHAQSTGNTAGSTGGNAAGSTGGSATGRSAQSVDGRQPQSEAAQNRELDQIGRKLLRETPTNSPNSEAATGGGLEPPTH